MAQPKKVEAPSMHLGDGQVPVAVGIKAPEQPLALLQLIGSLGTWEHGPKKAPDVIHV